jgi:hypothetical protein
VQAFLSWAERNFAYSVFGSAKERPFVPLDKIQRYFSKVPATASSNQRLDALLIDLFYPQHPPVDSDTVQQSYLLVLCILLSCGEGKHVRVFIEQEMSDRELPFLKYNSPVFVHSSPDLKKDFSHNQWRFCVPIFETPLLQNRTFDDNQRLPIVREEELDPATDLGNVLPMSRFRIWLYKSYNKLIDEETKAVCHYIR